MSADPIQLEVFRNLYASVAEEMGAALFRSAFSPNITERRDCSCALFDGDGVMVAQAAHVPVHLGSTPLSVEAAIRETEIGPGDVVLLNDPFRGGTHLPDVTAVSGVFLSEEDAKPSFFVANRAHHADVGGISPGSMGPTTEIFQEGIRIPPVRLVRGGETDRDLLAMLLANVRTPDERLGDLTAQIAANRTGERRVREIARRYGRETALGYARELVRYTARRMRARLASLPDGAYAFEDALDDDGTSGGYSGRDSGGGSAVSSEGSVPIRVRLEIRGRRARVDFRGSAPQVAGNLNANLAITRSAVFYVFRTLLDASVPSNAGCLEPVEIRTEAGTIVDARPPAAVAGGNVETSQRIVDVLFGALAQALPDRIPAASAGTMNNVVLGGHDPRTGRPFTYYETLAGGMGARPSRDGLSAVHTHMTNTRNTPIEALETAFPLRVTRYEIRRRTGGRGRHRGGDGLVREVESLAPVEVTLLGERRRLAPYGLEGGEDGKRGRDFVVRDGRSRRIAGKHRGRLGTGDRVRVETPGGGGHGTP